MGWQFTVAAGIGSKAGTRGAAALVVLCAAIPALMVGVARAESVVPVFLVIDSGERHSCAVLTDGKVVCWGADDRGQLGDGDASSEDRSVAVQVEGIDDAVDVTVGNDFSCALLGDQSLRCWGGGSLGQLGNASTSDRSSPVTVLGIGSAVDVAAGRYHACAALANGDVACWGYNQRGQLGNGTNTNSSVPVDVSSLSTATAISAGGGHSCARLSDGSAACWGHNHRGQLGDSSNTSSLVPVAVSIVSDFEDVALGTNHSCALRAGGTVICWGDNYYGQLGDGAILYRTSTGRNRPLFNVIGISTAHTVTSGVEHGCATLTGGEMRCWGRNDFGMLGDGSYGDISTPVSVSDLTTAELPGAGKDHTCALLSDGHAYCWGFNFYGQLGDGSLVTHDLSTTSDSPVPARVDAPKVTAMDTGNAANCAVLGDASAWCWGATFAHTPVVFADLTNVVDVGAGGNHACVVLDDGTMQCRGRNDYGQLGDGTTTDSYFIPVSVVGIATATAVDSKDRHTCAVLTGGSVLCWGRNEYGQLGDGSTVDSSLPVPVGALPPVASVATGLQHTCAATQTGSVYCWGRNYVGELGGGTTELISTTPVAVPGLSNLLTVSAGTFHTCALLVGGEVRCWGGNDYGQMGDGTTGTSSLPVEPLGLPAVAQMSVGGNHSCALLASGGIRCWGRNHVGQLGNGTLDGSPTPGDVLEIDDAWTVNAGSNHTCAGVAKSLPWGVSMRCWGRAVSGSLGNDWRASDPPSELAPVPVIQSFTPIRFRLTVETQGDGTGTVTTLHPGIDCGTDCSEDLEIGSVARLVATPDPPAGFNGWGGDADCSDGVVTLDADRHCIALVPEPGGLMLLGAGVAALLVLGWRRAALEGAESPRRA